MAIKSQSVSMPMSSAGIMGFSSDTKTNGFEIDPKMLIIATAVLVVIVKLSGIIVS